MNDPNDAAAAVDTAEIVSGVVDRLAEDVGQDVPVKTVITDVTSKTGGIAAYYVESDTLYVDPGWAQLIVDDPELYASTGMVLHELGHRADRRIAVWRMRSYWWPVYFIAPTMFPLLLIGQFMQQTWAWVAMSGLFAVWGLIFIFVFIPLSWYAEFRADDFCCDTGGISKAAMFLFVLCDVRLPFGSALRAMVTHPPSGMRFRRQMRRAGFNARMPH